MKFKKSFLNKIKRSPLVPGCYMYKNKSGRILYIGKAVNIRNRVNSYFTNFDRLDPKIKSLIEQVTDVEFVTTDSELEALILETNLIKKYKPKYNRMMKDDKNYVWLMITKNEDFPRIEIVREKKKKTVDYFGPFANPKPIRRALKGLRRIFPYRSCNRKIHFKINKNGKKVFYSSDKKPCLYQHLELCDAPCTGRFSKTEYRKNINSIKHFFRSKKFKVVENLKKEMSNFSKNLEFEKAAKIKNKLEDLEYISQRIRIEHEMDEKMWKEKKEEMHEKAQIKLIQRINPKPSKHPKPSTPYRIECYDISNISGKSATGSMVVFIDGKPAKNQYRKFKIKTKEEPDDFLMLKEVFRRRFNKTKINEKKLKGNKRKQKRDESFSALPNLIIVDGGKGQLSSTLKVLEKLKLDIPIVGLAKREEEIIKAFSYQLPATSSIPVAGARLNLGSPASRSLGEDWKRYKFKTIKLPRGSNELFLIQRIRDEAHRFAIKYHRVLRSKKQVVSVLDNVPGVGRVIRKRLLKAFGSTDGIKKAKIDELQAIVKNRSTVESLRKLL
jgi:excinuclease ABC subunit C